MNKTLANIIDPKNAVLIKMDANIIVSSIKLIDKLQLLPNRYLQSMIY